MSENIHYAELNRFLEELGFVRKRVPGSHVRWEHPSSDTEILLPDKEEDQAVWINELFAIRAILDRNGILDRDDFDRWRLGPATDGHKPDGRKGRKGVTHRHE